MVEFYQILFQVFIAIPAFCFVISIYLVIAPLLENPSLVYLYATIFILAGLIFYFPFVQYKYSPPFMGRLSKVYYYYFFINPFQESNEGANTLGK